MGVACWLSLALLGSNPELGLVVTSRNGITSKEALQVAEHFGEALERHGVELTFNAKAASRRLAEYGISDSSTCERRRDCALNLGVVLGTPVLLAFEVGALGKTLAVHVEALDVQSGQRLARADFTAPRGAQDFEAAASLAAQLRKDPPPSLPKDAPRVDPTPEPALVQPPSPTLPLQPTVSKAPAYATAGVAAAGAVTALVFLARGQVAAQSLSPTVLPDGRSYVPLPADEAQERVRTANHSFAIAAGAAAGAVAVGAAAAWLYWR